MKDYQHFDDHCAYDPFVNSRMDGIDKEEKKRLKKELEEKKRLEKWWMECKSQYRYEHIKQKTKARTREHM